MRKSLSLVRKGFEIIGDRVRTQGLRTTGLWFLIRGLTFVSGVPTVRYSQITPQLYVGPQYRSWGKRKLERLGIRASVNMRTEFDDAAHGLALTKYCHLPTVDDQPPTLAQLQRGVEFIAAEVEAGGKVYIHCAGGIGRAPTMAAAYFMSQGLNLEQALAKIRQARPFIRVMPEQLARLRELQTSLQS